MTATLEPPLTDDLLVTARAEQADAARRTRRARLVHLLGMPSFLLLVSLALYLWVSGTELDAVEANALATDRLVSRTYRHIQLSVLSTVFVLLLAVPFGILATRPGRRRLAPLIIGLGNIGQAIPSLGLLALLFWVFRSVDLLPSTGMFPVVVALVGYSFLPILRNTMVGLQQVDRDVLEAGRGMGMPDGLVLRRLELPLAVPVILAGIRTALVINVGTASLAFLFGGGGLGEIIDSGFKLNRTIVTVTGAAMVAILALLVDWAAGIVEERLAPKGL